MADFSIDDLWWLKPDKHDVGAEWFQGMKFGAQQKQQTIENAFRAEELRNQGIRMRAAADSVLAKQITDVQRAKGFAALSSHLANVAQTNGWGDPKNESEYWGTVAQFAPVFDKDEVDKIYSNTYG